MSEHFFGLFSGHPKQKWCKRAEKVAKKHGAWVTVFNDPADGYRGWFSCRNRGNPIDDAIADAVLDDLSAKGLWPIPEELLK